MNIHPLFVHFPIALFTLYVIFEILPLMRWYPQMPWEAIKAILVITGTISAVFAGGTGGIASELLRADKATQAIIEIHKLFAVISTCIFGVIAYSYLIQWLSLTHQIFAGKLHSLSFLETISTIIARRWIVVLLAIIGFVAITITGGLGASMVYGPNADPFVTIIYSLFF